MTVRRDPLAALTLVEMLVVLLVIGVASGATVMGTAVLTRDTRVSDAATALAVHLQAAADEALTGGRKLEMEWSSQGYGFRRWLGEDAGWGAARDARLGAFRSLGAGVALVRADGGEGPVVIAPDGMGTAVVMALRGHGALWTVAFDGLRARAEPAGAAP